MVYAHLGPLSGHLYHLHPCLQPWLVLPHIRIVIPRDENTEAHTVGNLYKSMDSAPACAPTGNPNLTHSGVLHRNVLVG